jgi:hypothetical protein
MMFEDLNEIEDRGLLLIRHSMRLRRAIDRANGYEPRNER